MGRRRARTTGGSVKGAKAPRRSDSISRVMISICDAMVGAPPRALRPHEKVSEPLEGHAAGALGHAAELERAGRRVEPTHSEHDHELVRRAQIVEERAPGEDHEAEDDEGEVDDGTDDVRPLLDHLDVEPVTDARFLDRGVWGVPAQGDSEPLARLFQHVVRPLGMVSLTTRISHTRRESIGRARPRRTGVAAEDHHAHDVGGGSGLAELGHHLGETIASRALRRGILVGRGVLGPLQILVDGGEGILPETPRHVLQRARWIARDLRGSGARPHELPLADENSREGHQHGGHDGDGEARAGPVFLLSRGHAVVLPGCRSLRYDLASTCRITRSGLSLRVTYRVLSLSMSMRRRILPEADFGIWSMNSI
jgi:hypothetical protein